MKTILSLLFLSCSISLSAQLGTNKLAIVFNNLSSNNGFILVLVEDENEKEISKLVLPIHNLTSMANIFLPKGQYSITAFHDLNGNEKLDLNFLGIPTEPFGFSNDARSMLKKPDIEERLINLNEDKSVTFKLDTYL